MFNRTYIQVLFSVVCILSLLFACSPLDQKAESEAWLEAKKTIQSDSNIHRLKRAFIIDQIDLIFVNKKEKHSKSELTFAELLTLFERKYDSINASVRAIKTTNATLDAITQVKKAESVSLDSDRGFIIFTIDFTRIFDDTIDYMVLTYQYIDDYDQLYFSENSKLSYQAAENFEGQIQVIMTDIFNGENEFIYLNTELSATEVLQKNYGIDDAGSSIDKEYLRDGLKVMVSAVKLKNGGFLKRRNGKWPYYHAEQN